MHYAFSAMVVLLSSFVIIINVDGAGRVFNTQNIQLEIFAAFYFRAVSEYFFDKLL